MKLSYNGWLVFIQPLRLLVAVSGFALRRSELLEVGDSQVGN